MRRGKGKTKEEYIKIRVSQLKEDFRKASDEYDKRWYLRLIEELNWVLKMTKLMDQVKINKYANDYIKMVEETIQKEVYVKFKLASVKLDWSPKRRSSRADTMLTVLELTSQCHILSERTKVRFIVCMSTSLLTPILILVESIQETSGTSLS